MRRKRTTQNRSRRQDAAAVSLFPFLAVLICTMGSLILLLVVIARQAKLHAAEANREAAAEAAESEADLVAAREEVLWRIEMLKQSRKKTEEQLSDARLNLGQIEDHARRLREEVLALQATMNDLDRLSADDSRQRGQLASELARLKGRLARAERELAEARKAADARRRSYAVVPYKGRHGTHQRPIYIECTAEAVILQPEGIRLTERHFAGPMGPGNPLAAALRAKREYLLTQGAMDPEKAGEPYPLLLVRPEGIEA